MIENLSWHQAMKIFNDKRKTEGGKYTIPKRGSEDYVAVRKLMGGEDVIPLKPDQTVKDQVMDRSKGRTPPKQKT